MFVFLMRPPTGAVRERHRAVPTLVRRLAGVDALVLTHQHPPCERLAAHETSEWFLARVDSHVFVKGGAFRILAAAHFAFVGLIVTGIGGHVGCGRRRCLMDNLCVCRAPMLLQIVACVIRGAALRAHARFAGRMRVSVGGERSAIDAAQAANVARQLIVQPIVQHRYGYG